MSREQLDRLLHWTVIALFHFLVLTVPFFFTWVNEELFEFNKMLLVYGLTILIACAWVSRWLVNGQMSWKKTSFDLVLGLFLLSQLLSTIFSIHPATSIFGYYTRFHGGLLSTICYILLYYAFVNTMDRKHLNWWWLSVFVGGAGAALYSIPEHFGHSPSCWLITNGLQFDTTCWIQDVQSRVFGTFGQPNWLAAYAITLLPVGVVLSFNSAVTARGRALFFGLTSWLLLLSLLYTASRSGFAGFLLSVLILVLGGLWVYRKPARSVGFSLSWALGLFAILGLTVAYQGSTFTPALSQLLNKPSATPSSETAPATASTPTTPANRLEEGGTESGEIRKIVWTGAIRVWQRYPILGSGVETFAYSYYSDRPVEHNLVSEWDFLYNKAHNEFLNYLATTGVVGLSAYVAVLAWFGWIGLRFLWKSTTHDKDQLLMVGLLAGQAALAVSNFFGFSTVMVTVLMFLYLAVAWLITHPPTTVTTKTYTFYHPPAQLSWSQISLLIPVLVIGSYLLAKVALMWWADYYYVQGKNQVSANNISLGFDYLQKAVSLSPGEALYHDEVSSLMAGLAYALYEPNNESNLAQVTELAEAALAESDTTLALNPYHINFYKTRARVFITLAQLQPDFLSSAEQTLVQGLQLAPTDAKLMYNLGLVYFGLNQPEKGFEWLEKAITAKDNYETARSELAKQYELTNDWPAAQAQYQYILDHINPNNEEIKNRLATLEASMSGRPK